MKNMGDTTSRLGRTLCGAAATLIFLAGARTAIAMPSVPATQNGGSHYVQLAGIFGESDEEKAARLAAQQREQAQDASLANLTQRVSDLEHTLRQLTGQLEEANHANMLLQQKIARMKKDFDYRLCQISARQLGAATSAGNDAASQPSIDCAALNGAGGQSGGQYAGQAQIGPAAGAPAGAQSSGVLGTLPAGTALPQAQTPGDGQSRPQSAANSGTVAPAPTGNGVSRKAFSAAMNLLAKAQYDQARAAFRSFADTYPKDDLAPQAVYWIGSIAYVQKDYPGAARAFAEEIKEYPDSPRGPEAMLKLGQSLLAMNQKDEGCTTLGALRRKYPHASKAIRRQAASARRDARCH
jgi:tol-pal system protein YbgF